MPQISVIVPVYNVEKYIHRCVDSILCQSFRDFELILVDDGSPDKCGAICDEYAKQDSRVVVIHQENGGLSAARNAGIDWAFANSDSQWLTFVDSDDWVHPRYLELLLYSVQSTNTQVAICAYQETNGDALEICQDDMVSVAHNTEDFYVHHTTNATIACGKLYKKECFQGIRYPVGKIHEDEYVTYRILFRFLEISFVPAQLYAYYINPEGITKKPWSPKRLDVIDALNQQQEYFKKYYYHRAHALSVQYLVSNLVFSLQRTQNAGMRIAHIKLKGMLVLLLIRYKTLFPFVRKNYWLYEQAFPKTMYLYWIAVGVTNKLKRSLKICRK